MLYRTLFSTLLLAGSLAMNAQAPTTPAPATEVAPIAQPTLDFRMILLRSTPITPIIDETAARGILFRRKAI